MYCVHLHECCKKIYYTPLPEKKKRNKKKKKKKQTLMNLYGGGFRLFSCASFASRFIFISLNRASASSKAAKKTLFKHHTFVFF